MNLQECLTVLTQQAQFEAIAEKEEDKPLIANTADNRKAVAKKRAQKRAEEENEKSGGMLSSFGLGGMKMPSLNTSSLIQKFEKASGVNFKSIGKQFK